MKSARILLAVLAMLTAFPPAYGQDAETTVKKTSQADVKEKGREIATVTNDQPPETPLKVQIVFTEFDGTQKISSLPYTLNMLGTEMRNRKEAHLRFGVRVPVTTGANTFTYQDVGTNIDVLALQRDTGEYRLDLSVDRSSVTTPQKGTDWKPGDSNPSTEPLIRSFRDDFTVVLKNGQSVEGTSAVDPATGHVVKVEVTLTVMK
jgi:hypothetical protein